MDPRKSRPPGMQEEKRESKPWTIEEKKAFYEGFGKYYRKFTNIQEMVGIALLVIDRSSFHLDLLPKSVNSFIVK